MVEADVARPIKIALVQTRSATGEIERNVDAAVSLIRSAASREPDLIVLPEFFSTGCFAVDWDYDHMKLAESEQGRTVSTFRQLARELGVHITVPFYEMEAPGLYFDTSVIISPGGEVVAKYRKTHAPARLSVEKIFYRPASRLVVFSLLGWRVGMLICYDSYFPETVRILMLKGAELIIVPFAEMEGFRMWTSVLTSRAFENGVYLAACNLVGPDRDPPKAIMGGQSLIIDPEGKVLAEGSTSSEDILTATLERVKVVEARVRRQFLRDRRPELYETLTQYDEDARQLTN